MFSFSMGNISWLLAEPCLLPLLPSSWAPSHQREQDPEMSLQQSPMKLQRL